MRAPTAGEARAARKLAEGLARLAHDQTREQADACMWEATAALTQAYHLYADIGAEYDRDRAMAALRRLQPGDV